MNICTKNPATGVVEEEFSEWEPQYTLEVVEAVSDAWRIWARSEISERCALMRRVAAVIREDAERLARLVTLEMGKPIRLALAEVNKCAMICEFYADRAPDLLKPEPVEDACSKAMVEYAPMGTVLAIMPWNFPFWQVFRIAAPTLMAGNAMVLKHAPSVPQCALAIEDVFRKAGAPANVFRSLLTSEAQVEAVIAHPSVVGVSLTGSAAAGSCVASLAGKYLKKSVMELGGSDPYILLPDADMEKAVKTAIVSRCGNSGQTCIASKRMIIHEDVYDEFLAALLQGMADLTVGDPMDMETDLGPLSSESIRAHLQEQVDRAVAAGARVLCGGSIPEGEGYFYPPTIIVDLSPEAAVAKEEFFGPVALVFKAVDEEGALAIANATPYGLGGSVWTADLEKGRRMAQRIQAGTVFVNGQVRSDPHLPFGGIKQSGYGRELAGYGLREFVNIKSICID